MAVPQVVLSSAVTKEIGQPSPVAPPPTDADGASVNNAIGAYLETEIRRAAFKAELVDIVKKALKPLEDRLDKLQDSLDKFSEDLDHVSEVLDKLHQIFKPIRGASLDDTINLPVQVYKLTAELANDLDPERVAATNPFPA